MFDFSWVPGNAQCTVLCSVNYIELVQQKSTFPSHPRATANTEKNYRDRNEYFLETHSTIRMSCRRIDKYEVACATHTRKIMLTFTF